MDRAGVEAVDRSIYAVCKSQAMQFSPANERVVSYRDSLRVQSARPPDIFYGDDALECKKISPRPVSLCFV